VIGPGYDAAVVVGNLALPRRDRRNLALTGSTIKGSYIGAWALGCGTDPRHLDPGRGEHRRRRRAGTQLLPLVRAPERAGIGLLGGTASARLAVRGNTFEDSDAGSR